VYRPLNLPSPARFAAFFERFERIVRAHGGRPHASKAHAPGVYPADDEGERRLAEWRRCRDRWDEKDLWWNGWLETHFGKGVVRMDGRQGIGEVMGEEIL
jgi:hypothetical protein